MVAPKTMAHRMSQMVLSIPAIPLEESNALAMSLEVEMALSNAMDWMHALNAAEAISAGFITDSSHFSNDVRLKNNSRQHPAKYQ